MFLQDGNNSACYRLPHFAGADKRTSDLSFRNIAAPVSYGNVGVRKKVKTTKDSRNSCFSQKNEVISHKKNQLM